MNRLTLDSFLAGPDDLELRQYRVLKGLKDIAMEFSQNRLYPAFAEIIRLTEALEDLLARKGNIEGHLPQHVKEVDLERKRVVFEPINADDPAIKGAMEIIEWALPLLRKLLEEGREIFSFVEGHMSIEGVGILPMYREEGYWFVPDLKESLLHLLRYKISLFSSATEHYRALKTVPLETVEEGLVKHPPESLKLALIEKYRDMPNPATYRCEVEIEFPYTETILPVAKRKFMARLSA